MDAQHACHVACCYIHAIDLSYSHHLLLHLQVTQAIVKIKAPETTTLGIIPMGTANDFATGLGIPEDPWEAMQLAAHDTARPIDVGTVNNEVCFKAACILNSPAASRPLMDCVCWCRLSSMLPLAASALSSQ